MRVIDRYREISVDCFFFNFLIQLRVFFPIAQQLLVAQGFLIMRLPYHT